MKPAESVVLVMLGNPVAEVVVHVVSELVLMLTPGGTSDVTVPLGNGVLVAVVELESMVVEVPATGVPGLVPFPPSTAVEE